MPQQTVLNTVSTFKRGNYPFPKDDIDPKKKDEGWGLKMCQAIYAKYVSDQTGLPYSNIESLMENRAYAAGNQDNYRYKKILLDEAEDTGEMEGWVNLSWEPMPVMPKFLHIIRGIFEEQEHKAVATAVDPKSSEERMKAKITKWFKGRYKPMLKAIEQMTGADEEPEWIPENVGELELYEQAGGLKLAIETEIEEALTYSWYISDWKEIKRKMLDDFATINCAATRDYTDRYTQKAKVRYVDPLKLVMQYSRHSDYKNAEFAGEIITESISNIRKNTGLEEEQLKQVAQFYNGRNNNRTLSSWDDDYLYDSDGSCKFDDFYVDVMDCEWFSVNSEYRTKRTNDRGETLEYDEKFGKVYDTDKKKTSVKDIKVVYRGKLIVGTDYIYDFGLQYDVPRPGKKEVELSFKLYRLPGKSIVELSRPYIDQMCLTWYRLQNAIAMASNSGIAVEYTSLQNMSLGDKKLSPLDILQIRRDTGDLIYKATTHRGTPNLPGGMRPIQELQGGIGNMLGEAVTLFELNLNFIRELTGINKVADASNPDPNQSVKGSEIAIAATNNALKPIYSGYIRIKEQTARSLAIRIQISLANNKDMYEGYVPIVGGTGVKLLTLSAGVVDADWSIMIQAKPTAQRKQILLQAATEAMKRDKDGYSDLEYKDFLVIERLLEEGNEKLAEMLLTYFSNKNKAMRIQIQRENMAIDAQNQQATQQQKAQAELQTLQTESGLKMKETEHEMKLKEGLEYKKHIWKMEEIKAENAQRMNITDNKKQSV
jgi:hypothetical protein